MKKVLSLILCVLLCLNTIPAFTTSVHATDKSYMKTYSGYVNMNLPADGYGALKSLKHSTIKINDSNCTNTNQLSLSGKVCNKYASYPFKLNGSFFKSPNSTKTLIGDFKDSLGNFDVAYIALKEDIQENELRINKSLAHENILQLYLLRTGTREFYTYDINLNDFANCINYSYQDALNLEDLSKEQWWVSVYKPVDDNTAIAYSIRSDNSSTVITYQDGPNNCYTYSISLRADADVRNYSSSSYTTDTFTLKVTKSGYSHFDGFKTYYYDTPALKVTAEAEYTLPGKNPDTISSVNFGAISTITTGGLKLDCSLDVAYSFGPLGASLSWEPYKTITKSDNFIAFPSTEKVRAVKVPFDGILTKVGDKVSLDVAKDKGAKTSDSLANGNKLAKVVFTCSAGLSPNENLKTTHLTLLANY